jgi:hypothetical protein
LGSVFHGYRRNLFAHVGKNFGRGST